jgi:D-alanine-D-alanine ligase
MDKLLDNAKRIATERVKWSRKYQQKYGITSREAGGLPEGKAQEIQGSPKGSIAGSSSADMLELTCEWTSRGDPYVLEANPNP